MPATTQLNEHESSNNIHHRVLAGCQKSFLNSINSKTTNSPICIPGYDLVQRYQNCDSYRNRSMRSLTRVVTELHSEKAILNPNFTFRQFKPHQIQLISLKYPHLFQLRAFGHRPLPLCVSERKELEKYVGFGIRKPINYKRMLVLGFENRIITSECWF